MAERGSTLPEVLVALAVLGIGIAGCARLLLLGVASESQAAVREIATLRLADALELSRAWPAALPAARLADWQASAATLRPGAPHEVTGSLQRLPAPADGLQSIEVALRWGDTSAEQAALGLIVFVQGLP